MELIIFFTNENKLGKVGVRFTQDLNDTNKNQNYEYRFQEDKVILIVNDMIEEGSIQTTLSKYSNLSKVFYVHHTLPSVDVRKNITSYCSENNIEVVPQGDLHERGKSNFYHLVGEFCQQGAELNIAFFDELKSKFSFDEVLEKKLTLLHECLHHVSAAKADIRWLEEPQQSLVRKLVEIGDNLDPNYIVTLTQLRKDLLGS
jgi:hypothetical protein